MKTNQKQKGIAARFAGLSRAKKVLCLAAAVAVLAAAVLAVLALCGVFDGGFRYDEEDLSPYIRIDLDEIRSTEIELTPEVGDGMNEMQKMTAADFYGEIASKLSVLPDARRRDELPLSLGDTVSMSVAIVKVSGRDGNLMYETLFSCEEDEFVDFVLGRNRLSATLETGKGSKTSNGYPVFHGIFEGFQISSFGTYSGEPVRKTFTITNQQVGNFYYLNDNGMEESFTLDASTRVEVHICVKDALCLSKDTVSALDALDDGYAVTPGIEDTDAAYAADYRAHLFEAVCDNYVNTLGSAYRDRVLELLWEKLYDAFTGPDTVLAYPEKAMDEYYDNEKKTLQYQYENDQDENGFYYYELYPSWQVFALIETFGESEADVAGLSLREAAARTEEKIAEAAKTEIGRRLLVYAIAKAGGFTEVSEEDEALYRASYRQNSYQLYTIYGVDAAVAEAYAEAEAEALSEADVRYGVFTTKAGEVLFAKNTRYPHIRWINPAEK